MFYIVNVVVEHLFFNVRLLDKYCIVYGVCSLDNFAIILNRKWDRLLAQKKEKKKESGTEYLEQRIFLKLGTGFIHD